MRSSKETKKFPRVRKSMIPKSMIPKSTMAKSVRPKAPIIPSKVEPKPSANRGGLAERLAETERDLEAERKARATESDLIGMMLVRVAESDQRAQRAEDALAALRALPPARPDTIAVEGLEARVRELEAKLADARRAPEAGASQTLEEIEERLAEVTKERERAIARAEKLSAGLDEMRAILADCGAIYEELERREIAIAGIRSRSLQDARAAFLRAAGEPARERVAPPPLPQVVDVSEVAVLIESMRPVAIAEVVHEARASQPPIAGPDFGRPTERP